MKKLLLCAVVLVAALLGACACSQKTAEGKQKKTVLTVDINEFEKAIARPDVVLLDVRTPDEFAEGHLKDAILIDVKESGFLDKCLKQLPAGKTVAVYCRTGFRSKSAGNILAEAGFDVINMKGGITAWMEAGKEVVK